MYSEVIAQIRIHTDGSLVKFTQNGAGVNYT